MMQLKFDKKFKKIVRDIPYWKTEEDIPSHIKDFLYESFIPDVIFNDGTGEFHCFYCLRELDENLECSKCNVSYKDIVDHGGWTFIENTKEQHWENSYHGFVFDVVNQDVLLYDIEIIVQSYYNDCAKKNYMKFNYRVNHAYFIAKKSFKDLFNDEEVLYDDYYKNVYLEYNYNVFDMGILYTENLDSLKNTIYRYSFLWKAKDYLKKTKVYLYTLHFLPIYFPQFEYLMKENLFNLAFDSPEPLKKNKTFSETFGLSKEYLPLIKKHNMTWHEVRLLSAYPTEDYSLLQFFCRYDTYGSFIDLIKKYKIDLASLKRYLEDHGYLINILEYFDYIRFADELQLDLKSKKILYPSDLLSEHNKLYLQKNQVNDPLINKKINDLASILSINKYEDEKYVIFPADSVEALMDESTQQHNCVCSYCENIAKNFCQIYFMRKKETLKDSFVTVEVRNNKVVQAKAKYNELPSEEANAILQKWEQKLIPVVCQ